MMYDAYIVKITIKKQKKINISSEFTFLFFLFIKERKIESRNSIFIFVLKRIRGSMTCNIMIQSVQSIDLVGTCLLIDNYNILKSLP